MLRRLNYFARQAAQSIRQSPGVSALTSGTIAAALVVLGLYFMALQNLEGLALVWGRSATVAAYVADDVPQAQWEALRDKMAAIDGVSRADLVTPKQALERFRSRSPSAQALVEGVTGEILSASVELQLDPGFADLDKMRTIASSAGALEGIDEVDFGQAELSQLEALLELLRLVGITAGLLLAIATSFIVSNTIRLTVYARRDEISILRLVGATAWFVRTPFLLEGALWGITGGVLGSVLLFVADIALAPKVSAAIAHILTGLDVRFFEITMAGAMVLMGIVLGVVGSGLAVRRFLDDEGFA